MCAALTAPTGLAIITSTFPEGAARNRAVAVYSLFGACGFSLGLVLSGLLTEVSWRWTFAFPAPVAALLLLLGLRLVPEQRGRSRAEGGRSYELPTAFGLPAALLALVYGIGHVPGHGWRAPGTLAAFALAGALAVLVVIRERRAEHPLLPLGVLAQPALRRAALGAAALNGSYLGLLFVVTFHLQTLLGWSPARTGLALLPAALPLALSAAYSGRMVQRFGTRRLIAVGWLAPPLGYALYLRASVPTRYATDLLPTLLLLGLAFVLCFAALHMQALTAAPKAEPGIASGVYQTAVQFGAAIVLALVAALMAAHHPAPGASAAAVLAGLPPRAAARHRRRRRGARGLGDRRPAAPRVRTEHAMTTRREDPAVSRVPSPPAASHGTGSSRRPADRAADSAADDRVAVDLWLVRHPVPHGAGHAARRGRTRRPGARPRRSPAAAPRRPALHRRPHRPAPTARGGPRARAEGGGVRP